MAGRKVFGESEAEIGIMEEEIWSQVLEYLSTVEEAHLNSFILFSN